MTLLTTLLALLIAARFLGEISIRLGQPAIIGEILAGTVLGPAMFGFVQPSEALAAISELAIFLIIMSSGLEMDFKEIASALRGRAFIVAMASFLLPLSAGLVLGVASSLDPMRTLFLGLCLSITALPVALRLLESLGLSRTPVARLTIGSAIFSDIAALLVLGIILRMPETFDTTAIAHAVAVGSCKLIVFAAIVLLLNHGLRVASGKGSNLFRLRAKLLEKAGPEALFGVSTLFVLAFSAVSETLGLHYVIGAFFGALLLDHDILGSARFKQIQQTTNSMSTGFLGPLFFAALGLQLQITSLRAPGFVVSLILVAVVSKVCAGLLATAIMGLNRRAAFQLGSLLNGRGVMGIVVADIALQRGFIGQDLFSVLILMSIVTTAVTPLLVRLTEPRTTTV